MRKMLQEMRVLDFSQNAAGPTCTAMLADYGADVIKIERPGKGDDSRGIPPMCGSFGTIHFWVNRGKKSLEVDLRSEQGREIIKKLVTQTDVVVESNRPGVMKKLGLDYFSLVSIKSDIIYLSLSAYGHTGPYAEYPGYDLIAQAQSGLMDLNGEADGAPIKSGLALADYWGGLNAYSAIVLAWLHHKKTGEGQHIDASLAMNMVNNNDAILSTNIGEFPTRTGNDNPEFSPYGLFSYDNNTHLVICVTNEAEWNNLCAAMNMPSLAGEAKFSSNASRIVNRSALARVITDWLKIFSDIQQAIALLEEKQVTCCKVLDVKELLNDPHVRDQQWVIDLELPEDVPNRRTFLTRNINAKFAKTPGKSSAAPRLGRDNYVIFGALGMNPVEIDALLHVSGAVGIQDS